MPWDIVLRVVTGDRGDVLVRIAAISVVAFRATAVAAETGAPLIAAIFRAAIAALYFVVWPREAVAVAD